MSGLQKMKLVAYSDGKFSSKVGDYTVMLNPESLKIDRAVNYNTTPTPDSGDSSPKYNETPGEQLSFDLVIDCTGIVDNSRTDLENEISKLKSLIYDFNGKIHQPNYVAIYWGEISSFRGVLTSMNISYTYFRPDGTALRAKVSLQFISYVDPKEAAKKENKTSPDLTHLVHTVDGESLPHISQTIYNNPEYYIQLAVFNHLNKFRHLPAGIQIVVPPLMNRGQL